MTFHHVSSRDGLEWTFDCIILSDIRENTHLAGDNMMHLYPKGVLYVHLLYPAGQMSTSERHDRKLFFLALRVSSRHLPQFAEPAAV